MPPPNESAMLEVAFDEATDATHEVLAAVAGKRHYIYAIWLISDGTVDVTPQSGATVLSGFISMVAQGKFELLFNEQNIPWFTCGVNEAFQIDLSAAIQVSGRVYYKTR